MPKVLRKLNLLTKDELLKSFADQKSVMVVEVRRGELIEGISFAACNENKQNVRSLQIIHLGCYSQETMLDVLIKSRDILFAKDPCSEITFSLYYNKGD